MSSTGAKKLLEDFLKDVKNERKVIQDTDHTKLSSELMGNPTVLTRRISSSSISKDPVEVDNNQLRHKLTTLRQENSTLVRQNNDLLQNLEKLTWEFSKSQNKLRAMDNEATERTQTGNIQALRSKISDLETENNRLNCRLRDGEQQEGRLQVASLFTKMGEHGEEKSRVDSVNKELKLEKELRKRCELQHEATVDTLETTQTHLDRLKERCRDRENQLTEQVRGLEERLSSARSQLKAKLEVETELEEMRNCRDHLVREGERLKAELEAVTSKELDHMSVRTDVARLKQKFLVKEAELERVDTLRRETETKLSTSESFAETLQEEIVRLQGDLMRTHDQLASGQTRLEELETSVIRLEKERAANEQEEGGEVERLKGVVSTADAALRELKTGVDQAVIKEEASRLEMEDLRKQWTLVTLKLTKESERSEELEALSNRLATEKSRLTDELSQIRDQVSRQSCEVSALEQRLVMREDRVAQLSSELEKRRNKEACLQRDMRRLAETLANQETEINNTTSQLTDSNSRFSLLEHTHEQLTVQLSTTEKALHDCSNQLLTARQSLASEQANHCTTRTTLEQDCSVAQHRSIQLTERVRDLEEEVDQARTRAEMLSEELAKGQVRAKELEKTIAEQSSLSVTALADLESRAVSTGDQMRTLQSALAACSKEIERLQDDQRWYEDELTTSKQKLDKVESALNDSQRVNKDLRHQLSLSEEHSTDLEGRLDRLVALETSLRSAEEGRKAALVERDDLERRGLALEEEMTALRQRAATSEKEVVRERSQHKATKRSLVDVELQLKCCREETGRLAEERVLLEKRLRSDIEALDERVRATEVERDRAQRLARETADLAHRADADRKSVQHQIRSAQEETNLAKKDTEEARSLLSDKTRRCRELESCVERSQEALIERGRDVDRLEALVGERTQELEKRATQLTALQAGVEDRLNDLKGEVEGCRKREQDARDLLTISLEEREVLDGKLKEKAGLIQEAEGKLRQLGKELDRKVKEMRGLQTEVQTVREEKARSGEETTTIRRDLVHTEVLLTESRDRVQASEREQVRLAAQLQESEQMLRIRCRELVTANERTASAKVEHGQEIGRLESAHRDTTRQLDEATTRHAAELNRLTTLHSQLMTEREKEVANLSSVFQQLRAALERQTRQLAGRQQHSRQLATTLEEANETLVVKEAVIARLEARLHQNERACGNPDECRRGSDSARDKKEVSLYPVTNAFTYETIPIRDGDRSDHSPPDTRSPPDQDGTESFRQLLDRVNARMDRRSPVSTDPHLDYNEEDEELLESTDDGDLGDESSAEAIHMTEKKLAQLQHRLSTIANLDSGIDATAAVLAQMSVTQS